MSGLNYSFVELKNEYCSITFGEMAEWSIATVSNTVKPVGFEGSNPSLSAEKISKISKLPLMWMANAGFISTVQRQVQGQIYRFCQLPLTC